MLYVPVGFAHGFCVISKCADVIYKCTEEYSPDDDGGIIWNDAEIGIKWPVRNPILSETDGNLKALKYARNNFEYNL
jgi:dTDP-4-dehydrorhamnose 3,5-epimerase